VKPCVFFDIDGTLFDVVSAMRAGASLFLERHQSAFPMALDELMQTWLGILDKQFERYLAGEIDFLQNRRAAMRGLFALANPPQADGMSDAEVDARLAFYIRHYEENYQLFEDAEPCLDALADLPMGIISNGDGHAQRGKIEKTGVHDRFDPIVLSGEAGLAKPDEGIFREACRRAGRAPEQCAYVGDRLETDALACRKIGMLGVWVNRLDDPAPANGAVMIRSLSEFPAIVRKLQRGAI